MSRRFAPGGGCPSRAEVGRLVELRDEDRLNLEEARWLTRHLEVCVMCRDEALRQDPTLLFTPHFQASASPGLAADADRVVADVLAALDVERARRKLHPAPARALLYAATIALVGAGLTGLWAIRTRAPEPAREAAAAQPRVEAAGPPRSKGVSRPLIEGIANPGATIYQFAGSGEEPNVVFIVDRNADI